MTDWNSLRIDPDLMIQTVREIAAEQPDHVYEKPFDSAGCFYTNPGREDGYGCIFGQAMRRLGYPIPAGTRDENRNYSNEYISCPITGGIASDSWGRVFGFEGEYSSWESDSRWIWMSRVQSAQDRGQTWADAVALADRLALAD